MKRIIAIVAAVLSLSAAVRAEVAVDSAEALEKAVRMSSSGETIRVAPGRYDLTDLKIPRDMTIAGDGDVVFYSSRPVEKGILNPLWVSTFRVENITFQGATSPDLNGAGIRHDGEDLTVINCVFKDNENGILATGQEHGKITIIGSKFINNGYGDGYSHGVYVASGAVLEIDESAFVGTKIGHHVKSLTGRTSVMRSSFDDANGRTSYSIDVSRGGAVSIKDNSFIQAANGDNSALFNYDLTRGGEAVLLEITGNKIINRNRNGRLLRNDTSLAPDIRDNEITNEAGGRLKLN